MKKVHYFNTNEPHSIYDFCRNLSLLMQKYNAEEKLVLLCIGSDRATGDALGPIIGYKLS